MQNNEVKKLNINWYPGHMARSKRLLVDQLKKADFIIELADARIPMSSRNPELATLCTNKKKILVLTKSDLANTTETKKWINHFSKNGEQVIDFDAQPKSRQKIMKFIDLASQEFIDKAKEKGIKKTIRAIVVGVPNVGKSTFINRIVGSAITSVANMPGHTKSNRWVKINPYLEIMDSPGLLWPRLDDENSAKKLAYIGTIKDAVYNTDEVAMELAWELYTDYKDDFIQRFKIKEDSYSKIDLLENICRGRGFLIKGGEFDYDRAISVILEEFRSAKIGRISLERVDDEKN